MKKRIVLLFLLIISSFSFAEWTVRREEEKYGGYKYAVEVAKNKNGYIKIEPSTVTASGNRNLIFTMYFPNNLPNKNISGNYPDKLAIEFKIDSNELISYEGDYFFLLRDNTRFNNSQNQQKWNKLINEMKAGKELKVYITDGLGYRHSMVIDLRGFTKSYNEILKEVVKK